MKIGSSIIWHGSISRARVASCVLSMTSRIHYALLLALQKADNVSKQAKDMCAP